MAFAMFAGGRTGGFKISVKFGACGHSCAWPFFVLKYK